MRGGKLKIRNWDKWQSYRRDRGQPPWIKVHREIMRNIEWVGMTDAQRGQLVAIWLLAADHDGVIPASPELVQKLCFMSEEPDLKFFMDQGFIEPDADLASQWRQDDAEVTNQRQRQRRDRGETEAEAESRAGTRDERAPENEKPPPKNRVDRPDWIDEQVWSDMLKLRRGHKATLTPTAWKKVRAQLEAGIEKGYDPNDMIAEWLDAGWRSFKLEWYENRMQKQGGQGAGGDSVDQQVRAAREYRERQKRLIEGETTDERQ